MSGTIEFQFDILTQGLLNETSDRRDDIFRGVRLEMEVQLESGEFTQFINRVKDRAQRRTPASEQFNALMTLVFPNGDRPRVLIEDLSFGSLPIAVGGRDEYVTVRVEAESSEGRFI
ncbi:MAG TPA: hypothetical protein ENK57_12305 [Polyangiaceae bacterium]|nr:hypothetical protein [Polyangiaceae bacterium]